jgi:predicted nucleic acid-binding protein
MIHLFESRAAVATTQPVTMEVLMGARDDAHETLLREIIGIASLLPFDPDIDFDAAAAVYRRCRSGGISPRSMIDCMIAAVAIRYNAAVLARDSDFAEIASVVPLTLDPATPR